MFLFIIFCNIALNQNIKQMYWGTIYNTCFWNVVEWKYKNVQYFKNIYINLHLRLADAFVQSDLQ